MRKYIDILNENSLFEAKVFQASYEDITDTFYKNPTLMELGQMLQKKPYRGLTDGKSIFLWDAEQMIHHQAAWALIRIGMWEGDTFPALTDKSQPAPKYVPENSTCVFFNPHEIAQMEVDDPAWVQSDPEDQDRIGIHSYRLAEFVAIAIEDQGRAHLMSVAPVARLMRNVKLDNS
jgi:hypothetical protein